MGVIATVGVIPRCAGSAGLCKAAEPESDPFIAAIPPRTGEGDQSQTGGGAQAALAEAEAEKGMAEMSRVYNEGGRELYIGAGDRERD